MDEPAGAATRRSAERRLRPARSSGTVSPTSAVAQLFEVERLPVDHSCGRDDSGQVSKAPTTTGFTLAAAGKVHSLALRSDGSIASRGSDANGQLSLSPLGTGFTQVAAGYWFSLALRADGSIVSWGRDNYGQVAAGAWHTLALHANEPGGAFCFGDGSGSVCPCTNFGGSGAGCANTSGSGARLSATGFASLQFDTFQLEVEGAPGSKPGLVLRGANAIANPVGDGLLCTAGQSIRSQVQVTQSGLTTFSDFQGAPFGATSLGTGAPTFYQFWYRDPQSVCGGAGFNFSNAWAVT